MVKQLTPEDVEHIKVHTYKTTGYSWLDNKLNPFWTKFAEYIPYVSNFYLKKSFYQKIKWISPNLVTLLGVFAMMSAIGLILFYDYTLGKSIPTWLYIYFAFSNFAYQTLDACDGKHARNTKRQSPLGQLMDHGCDAFSNSFIVVMIAQAHRFGATMNTLLLQVSIQVAFFAITWQEHHTGYLLTHVNNIGVTEFQFFGMAVILTPLIVGDKLTNLHIYSNFSVVDLLLWLNII